MEFSQLYIAFGLLAAIFCYISIIHRRRPTRNPPLPPGPAGLPIVGSLPFLDPELHTYFAGLAKVHGPIYTIKLGSKLGIVISSPDLAREALRDNDAVLANRDVPAVGRLITYGGSDIVWTPNGPAWRMLRRVCVQQMLSPSSLDSLYYLRRREDMVVGGTETTSNTVEWAIAEMMNRPDTMEKAREELEQVVGRNNIVEESHIPKLHYISSIMKEVLRLHPALPLLVPHCPSASCTIGGYSVPEGSRVFVNVWAIHRDSSVWDNPNEFLPERFFEGDTKYEYNGKDFKYFPFGSGRRICAGISMAERMSMHTVASLLHNFEWKLDVGESVDLDEKFGIVLKKARPLVAVPTPRFDNSELYS